MTRVLCTFSECKYYKHQYDEYGECQREEIILDEYVEGMLYGCPDVEWEEKEDDDGDKE